MLPKDPMILLSVVNTKLRDEYDSLDALCEDLDLDRAELEEKLVDLKKDLFTLRMQHATNQLDNPVKISLVKKDIARVKTILREKQLEQ